MIIGEYFKEFHDNKFEHFDEIDRSFEIYVIKILAQEYKTWVTWSLKKWNP